MITLHIKRGVIMFIPIRVIFEKSSFNYPKGRELYDYFREKNIDTIILPSDRIQGIPGKSPEEKYKEGKGTLIIGVRKSLDFQSCKPSAHYQLPLVSGCMGQCEYCYLNTRLGDRPYVRAYVNVEEILEQASKYIKDRKGEITVFEGAATSDPIPVEFYTKGLTQTIDFFAKQPKGRFRFVTKYTDVEDLLNLDHKGHTRVRFSLNTENVISRFEHHTPSARKRIEAAKKIIESGYPIGFIIAPVFLEGDWKKEYEDLFIMLKENIHNVYSDISFEIISHRFTLKAKERILDVFPGTTLPMNEEERDYKYGQFGYGKYVYKKQQLANMKESFQNSIQRHFPNSIIMYII